MKETPELFCPFCSSQLDSEGGYYSCLRCGAEVFRGDRIADPYAGWQECYREDVRRQPTKRAGGGKSGRRFNKKVFKPLPTERYRLE